MSIGLKAYCFFTGRNQYQMFTLIWLDLRSLRSLNPAVFHWTKKLVFTVVLLHHQDLKYHGFMGKLKLRWALNVLPSLTSWISTLKLWVDNKYRFYRCNINTKVRKRFSVWSIIDTRWNIYSISWFQNKGMKFDTSLKRDLFSYQATLNISLFGKADEGIYKVIVRNREGEINATATINIIESSLTSNLPPRPQYVSPERHDDSSSICSDRTMSSTFYNYDGKATPRQPFSPRRYYERKKRSQNSARSPNLRSHGKMSSLDSSFSSVSSLSSYEAGHSNCDTSVFSDDILSSEPNNSDQSLVSSSCLNSSAERSLPLEPPKRTPPRIVTPLNEKTIITDINTHLTLSCTFACHPKPKVVWMKDACDVSKEADFSFKETTLNANDQDAYHYCLTIQDPDTKHAGLYTVSAFNRKGEATSEYRLIIAAQSKIS